MKFRSAILLLLAGTLTAAAAPQNTLAVWPGQSPDEPGNIEAEKRIPLKPGQDPAIRITNVTRPTLAVYPAPEDKHNGAAVIICPGGGFRHLAYDKEGLEVAEWFNSLGVTAFVLKYRVPTRDNGPRFRHALQDLQRALSLVRSQADQWKIDPSRLGVVGFSAGGEVAARASLMFDQRQYATVDEIDAAPCRPDFAVLLYPAYLYDAKTDGLREDLKVPKDAPPMFFAHAFNDRVTCESSLHLFIALKKLEIPAELHIYESGGHGFGLRPSDKPASTWPARCAEWMQQSGWLEK